MKLLQELRQLLGDFRDTDLCKRWESVSNEKNALHFRQSDNRKRVGTYAWYSSRLPYFWTLYDAESLWHLENLVYYRLVSVEEAEKRLAALYIVVSRNYPEYITEVIGEPIYPFIVRDLVDCDGKSSCSRIVSFRKILEQRGLKVIGVNGDDYRWSFLS